MGDGVYGKEWEDLFRKLEGLGTSVTKSQLEAIARVPAKAANDLASSMAGLTAMLREFNRATSVLSVVIVILTAIMALAAVVQIFVR